MEILKLKRGSINLTLYLLDFRAFRWRNTQFITPEQKTGSSWEKENVHVCQAANSGELIRNDERPESLCIAEGILWFSPTKPDISGGVNVATIQLRKWIRILPPSLWDSWVLIGTRNRWETSSGKENCPKNEKLVFKFGIGSAVFGKFGKKTTSTSGCN